MKDDDALARLGRHDMIDKPKQAIDHSEDYKPISYNDLDMTSHLDEQGRELNTNLVVEAWFKADSHPPKDGVYFILENTRYKYNKSIELWQLVDKGISPVDKPKRARATASSLSKANKLDLRVVSRRKWSEKQIKQQRDDINRLKEAYPSLQHVHMNAIKWQYKLFSERRGQHWIPYYDTSIAEFFKSIVDSGWINEYRAKRQNKGKDWTAEEGYNHEGDTEKVAYKASMKAQKNKTYQDLLNDEANERMADIKEWRSGKHRLKPTFGCIDLSSLKTPEDIAKRKRYFEMDRVFAKGMTSNQGCSGEGQPEKAAHKTTQEDKNKEIMADWDNTSVELIIKQIDFAHKQLAKRGITYKAANK